MPAAPSKASQVRELLKTGMKAADIAKQVGCSRNLVYVIKSTSGRAAKPGRRRKPAAGANVNGLDGILAAVRDGERERKELRAVLERIRSAVADALA